MANGPNASVSWRAVRVVRRRLALEYSRLHVACGGKVGRAEDRATAREWGAHVMPAVRPLDVASFDQRSVQVH